MNVVKILLVLGLGYVALTQKVEKTRNMLIVVTGLLAFCMFSVEGFDSITFTDGGGGTISGGVYPSEGTITAGGATYTFPANFNAETDNLTTWTCPTGKIPGPLSPTALTAARVAIAGALDNTNINSVFPCVTGGTCPSTAPTTNQCGDGKKFKSTTNVNYTGAVGGDDYKAKCCETDTTANTNTNAGPCTADKCNTWFWFGDLVRGDCPGAGECGEKCATGVWDTFCDP